MLQSWTLRFFVVGTAFQALFLTLIFQATLHVGDEIREINGISVANQVPGEVCSDVQYSSSFERNLIENILMFFNLQFGVPKHKVYH